MSRANGRCAGQFSISVCAALALTLVAGCPMNEPAAIGAATADALHSPDAAGTYWVDRAATGMLEYYELSTARGADGRWTELGADATWFSGPGFYTFDGANWARAPQAAGLTLDEAVQLNDAAPAP